MFLLAASVVVAVSVPWQERLGQKDRSAWQRISPSVATIVSGDRTVGSAALIDRSGYFVAHNAAVPQEIALARLADGRTVKLQVVKREQNSDLVLLFCEGLELDARPFRAPATDSPNGALLAVIPSGPIRANFVDGRRFGVLGRTRRSVPISEIRFEAPTSQFGTGLLLTDSGELFGTLNGALSRAQNEGDRLPKGMTSFSVGPGSMTVAYSVGPSVIRRVLSGFLSPSHEVVFPNLGILCIDSVGGGALIQVVRPESPAASAMLQAGDVLLGIGNQNIANQMEFGRVMLEQEVGKKVTLRIRRNGLILLKDVTIGRADQ